MTAKPAILCKKPSCKHLRHCTHRAIGPSSAFCVHGALWLEQGRDATMRPSLRPSHTQPHHND